MAVARPETVHQIKILPQRRIFTGFTPLDQFIGGFEAEKVTLLDSGSRFVHELAALLCVQAIRTLGGEVVMVDGGNTADPYVLSNLAKRFGLDRNFVLERVNISRAFTAYQMTSLINESLRERVEERTGRMILISSLPDLFLDDDVWWPEAYELLRSSVSTIKEISSRYGTVTIVTNCGLSKLYQKSGLRRYLYGEVDKVVRFEKGRGRLRVSLPLEGRFMEYVPVPHNQMTLNEFLP